MPGESPKPITSAEACRLAGITPPGQDIPLADFLRSLIEKAQFPEAVRFAAHTMTARTAIAWVCASLKQLTTPRTDEQKAARALTEKWLLTGDDAIRTQAQQSAEAATLETPDGVLAMAVFMAGPNIAPPTAPAVPPPPHISQKLSAGAATLAVVSEFPEQAPERFRKLLEVSLKAVGR